MLKITEKLGIPATPSVSLTLPFEKRQKSRLRVSLNDKQEAALMLERGSILRHGDLLRAENGLIVEVRAANEEVAVISTKDSFLLARACYHLGNRHIPLQIGGRLVALSKRPCIGRNGSISGTCCETRIVPL